MRFSYLLSLFLVSWLALAAFGCATHYPEPAGVDRGSVTVVGVTRREGVSGINRNSAALDLVRTLDASDQRRVVAPLRAREVLGKEGHAAILERYERTGLVEARDLRSLMASPFTTQFALFARIERDETSELAPRSELVRDSGGRLLTDRIRVERATRRDVEISVVLVDLIDQRVRWRKRYVAAPITRGESVRYRGSSLSGSVAALLANRLVSGTGSPDAPPPAGRRATLEALFSEVERSLPAR